jgi:hypothetical protein
MNHDDKQIVERIAGEANQTGYIDTQKLCFILAEDPEYDVKGLMRVLGIDTRFFPKQKGQTLYRERVGKWHYIIQKMISWDFADMQGNRIPLYGSSSEGWCLIGADERFHKNIQYAFFKLTDLEKWFTETLKLPFPGCLIPRETETQDQVPKKQKKPNQKLFEKYTRLAKEFMSKERERTGQAPLRSELEDRLQALLQENNEVLGDRAVLPDAIFRKLWKAIPKEIKRDIGEKTRPTRK